MRYVSVLQQAIEFIEINLYKDIGLQDVANAVGYSYYHMTRLFTSSIKESVGSYIKKRRLYEASKRLIYSDDKIISIAMDIGFDSSEAFSRAFKALYGDSPSQYRKKGLHLASKAKKKIFIDDLPHILTNIELLPNIIYLDKIELMGIRGNTSLNKNNAPQLWAKYIEITKGYLDKDASGYSVCETSEANYTEDENLVFNIMIGSPVQEFLQFPVGFEKKIISGGKYAVFIHSGSFETLPVTYNYIWGVWAMSAKEILDNREEFEIHENNDAEGITVKIYIPIK